MAVEGFDVASEEHLGVKQICSESGMATKCRVGHGFRSLNQIGCRKLVVTGDSEKREHQLEVNT